VGLEDSWKIEKPSADRSQAEDVSTLWRALLGLTFQNGL
jgi:hypothetical protein